MNSMHRFTDIYRTNAFILPENQRGYSWKVKNVDDLIDDLALADPKSHYMGPVIVSRTERDSFQADNLTHTAEYLLEDGRQRVTTLQILASELRQVLLDTDNPEL